MSAEFQFEFVFGCSAVELCPRGSVDLFSCIGRPISDAAPCVQRATGRKLEKRRAAFALPGNPRGSLARRITHGCWLVLVKSKGRTHQAGVGHKFACWILPLREVEACTDPGPNGLFFRHFAAETRARHLRKLQFIAIECMPLARWSSEAGAL